MVNEKGIQTFTANPGYEIGRPCLYDVGLMDITFVLTVYMAFNAHVSNKIEPSLYNSKCFLYAVDSQASIVFASIQYAVLPERANVWTKTVFRVIQLGRYVSDSCSSFCAAFEWVLLRNHIPVENCKVERSLSTRFAELLTCQNFKIKLFQHVCEL